MSPDDPNHSVTGVAFQIFGTFHPNETVPAAQILAAETMQGFLQEEENVLKSTNLKTAGEVITAVLETNDIAFFFPRRPFMESPLKIPIRELPAPAGASLVLACAQRAAPLAILSPELLIHNG